MSVVKEGTDPAEEEVVKVGKEMTPKGDEKQQDLKW